MRIIHKIGFTALLLLFAGNALALDTSGTVLCASIDVHECIDGGGCSEVLPEDVNAPTFFRVDIGNEQVRVSKSGEPARIENIEKLADRTILQGIQAESAKVEGGTGWTMTIENDTGRMVVTATTQQAAVVIFGACTE